MTTRMNGMTDVNAACEMGRQAVEQGYETVREYAEKSADVVGDLTSKSL